MTSQWADDALAGEAVINVDGKETYRGAMCNGRRDGHGRNEYEGVGVYVGAFRNDKAVSPWTGGGMAP